MKHDDEKINQSIDSELEARVVAWVLGEASPFEVAELERRIAGNPALAVFKRRIEAVHGLVGEAAGPVREPLMLSPERRAKLLAVIGAGAEAAGNQAPAKTDSVATVLQVARKKKRRRWQRWMAAAAACLTLGVLLSTTMLPALREYLEDRTILSRPQPARPAPDQTAMGPMPAGVESQRAEPAPAQNGAVAGDVIKLEEFSVSTESKPSIFRRLQKAFGPAEPASDEARVQTTKASQRDGGAKFLEKQRAASAGEVQQNSAVIRLRSPVNVDANGQRKSELDRVAVTTGAGSAPTSFADDARALSGLASAAPLNAADVARTADGFYDFSAGAAGDKKSLLTSADLQLPKSAARSKNRQIGVGASSGSSQATQAGRGDRNAISDADMTFVTGGALSMADSVTGSGAVGGLQSKDQFTTSEEKEKTKPIVVLDKFVSSTSTGVAPNAPTQSAFGFDKTLPETPRTVAINPDSQLQQFKAGFTKEESTAGRKVAATLDREANAKQTLVEAQKLAALKAGKNNEREIDAPLARPASMQPAFDEALRKEIATLAQGVSTFSLHVSDVSFRLARAALERGERPDPATIRPEEFYNAFDYGDPSPVVGEPVSCRVEQSAHPFLQQRNLVRIAMKVPATGRGASQPLRLTVLLDTSGSMEREDRAASVKRALGVLASLLGPDDRVTLIGFARTPRLLADRLTGDQASRLVEIVSHTPAEGGTNLEEALKLAGEHARAQFTAGAQNRIVLLTDGAANLGNDNPAQLAVLITTLRQQGIAFDACGVGADGLDDSILEALTRKGDGRYYVINSPDEADAGFARQLAGAFRPAAQNVKVQVRFNSARVRAYRLIGFEQHRLREEDFRNDSVDAAELAAEEAAIALYQVEVLPEGEGELGEVFVRFRNAGTGEMVERSWTLSYAPQAPAFDRATPSMQLAGTSAFLAEKLRGGNLAAQIRLEGFAPVVNALHSHYAQDARVQEFVTMFGQTRRLLNE